MAEIISQESILGRITRATLQMDGTILSFIIVVDYEDGSSQVINSYHLDRYDSKMGRRVGTSYGLELIRRVLMELKASSFQDLVGKNVLILGILEDHNFVPEGIKLALSSTRVLFSEVQAEFDHVGNVPDYTSC